MSTIKKLTVLDKYILKNIFFSFFSVILILALVVAGRFFIKLLGYVADGKFDFEMILVLLALSTYKSVIFLLPFIIMISLILSLSALYRDSEIFAIKASGNYKATFRKLFFLIASLSFIIVFFLSVFANAYLITELEKKNLQAIAKADIGIKTPGKFIQFVNKNWVIFVEDIENNVSRKIFIKSSENNKISIETASEAYEYFDKGVRKLVLKNGQRYSGIAGAGNFQIMKYDKHEIKLLNTTPDLSYNYKMKNIFDLINDKNKFLSNAEIQWRLFAPISVVILILFAFVFGDIAPRQNKYSNLLIAIIVYFIYSNLIILSVNQIQEGSFLFSIIGTWWVHILAIITCYLFYLIKKYHINNYKDLIFFLKLLRK